MEYALVVLWLVAYYAFALAALPVASALFSRFPDRGATLALPVALGTVTLLADWFGQVAFTSATVAVAVAVVVAASALLARDRDLDLRAYAEAMAVFTVAFLFLVAVRAVDPAITPRAGEKFLDFGLLKSLMRAPALPPEDMWWAGEPVAYYYGGHLMTAVLTTITGTLPRYAYNLALAGFYAMLVTSVYGLAGAVADSRGASRRLAGGLAAFFVAFASNLFTALRLAAGVLPASLSTHVATVLEMDEGLGLAPKDFFYWDASRVIPGTITEFPLFAYINGDLHAHMMSQPFLVIVAALTYVAYRTPAEDTRRRQAIVFGALPAASGLVATTNFWSFPTTLGVTWLGLTFADAHPLSLLPRVAAPAPDRRLREELVRILGALAVTAVVGVLAFVWAGPFVLNVLLGAAGSRGIVFFPDRSSFVGLLVVHGAFLAVFALYLGSYAKRTVTDSATEVGALGAAFLFAGWQWNVAAIALVAPLLFVAWALLRTTDGVDFETVLVVAGAGLVLLVEFVYVRDNAVPTRYNTVFKVYMQVWVLWGTAAGVALASLVSGAVPDWDVPGLPVSRRQVSAVLAVALVLSTGVYGVFALGEHVAADKRIHRADDPTLDGKAFVESTHPTETAAIAWLDARSGRPHIVSAPGKPYQWSNPAASLTGLPTVVGWTKERIYRGTDAYRERTADVDQIYTADWETRERLLDRYDVRYIYLGPHETERYGRVNTDFDRYPGISQVDHFGSVRIYEVNQTVVGNASGA
ncbi:DUF2298 domain-containing protein [Halomicrococcus gelatinilyticus]|uniref:DUF2298 domain-containing protein n=1 Tax=Halomicrococcus gelatinilyticus TaxID=1702103 RepID=UPI002E0D2750